MRTEPVHRSEPTPVGANCLNVWRQSILHPTQSCLRTELNLAALKRLETNCWVVHVGATVQ